MKEHRLAGREAPDHHRWDCILVTQNLLEPGGKVGGWTTFFSCCISRGLNSSQRAEPQEKRFTYKLTSCRLTVKLESLTGAVSLTLEKYFPYKRCFWICTALSDGYKIKQDRIKVRFMLNSITCDAYEYELFDLSIHVIQVQWNVTQWGLGGGVIAHTSSYHFCSITDISRVCLNLYVFFSNAIEFVLFMHLFIINLLRRLLESSLNRAPESSPARISRCIGKA